MMGMSPADQRQDDVLPDEMLVPRIIRMHRDRGIAEHGLGPRRRHDQVFNIGAATMRERPLGVACSVVAP